MKDFQTNCYLISRVPLTSRNAVPKARLAVRRLQIVKGLSVPSQEPAHCGGIVLLSIHSDFDAFGPIMSA